MDDATASAIAELKSRIAEAARMNEKLIRIEAEVGFLKEMLERRVGHLEKMIYGVVALIVTTVGAAVIKLVLN